MNEHLYYVFIHNGDEEIMSKGFDCPASAKASMIDDLVANGLEPDDWTIEEATQGFTAAHNKMNEVTRKRRSLELASP